MKKLIGFAAVTALLVICAQALRRHHNKSFISPVEKQTLHDALQENNFDGTGEKPYGDELRGISNETKKLKDQKAVENQARHQKKIEDRIAIEQQIIDSEREKLGQHCANLTRDYQSHNSELALQQARNTEKQYAKYRIPFSVEFQNLIEVKCSRDSLSRLRACQDEEIVATVKAKTMDYLKDIPDCVRLNKVIGDNKMSINYVPHYGDGKQDKRDMQDNHGVSQTEGAICRRWSIGGRTEGEKTISYVACKYKMMIITISWE
ncbi:MAG: hypothetical protein PHF00_09885 [Elusimicrobia bacterium]|nr:hypothetical protein [Elusimicrobiota bacterium]